ncbi:MAG: hypothetical protein ABI693_18110 [Bryobacteraceae bacterium]
MNWKLSWKMATLCVLAGWQIMMAQQPLPPIHIIPLGSPLKFGGTNSPDTYSADSTFGPTPVLVDNGAVTIWQEQVATSSRGEWEIFHMKTTNGGPLAANINANWGIVLDYTTTAEVSFDAVVNQFSVNGTPFSPLTNFGSICCAVASNPILPGAAYYNQGFNAPQPAGVHAAWNQIYINPYPFALQGGINTSTANEFTFGLHFTLLPIDLPKVDSVISAGAFGAFPTFGPGSWIEIYGSNFAVGAQTWATSDFTNGVNAPTKLGGTSVTIGGQSAFVDYVSPTQMNAQVPSGIIAGPQSLIVNTVAGVSAPFIVTSELVKPGLLAPPSFNLGGIQYAVALFPDNVTYVLPPGAIAGVSSRRAKPADTITFYGIGFGSVTPDTPPGQVAPPLSTIGAPLIVRFGGTDAVVGYHGLAPSLVGLYQFNVVVPAIAASDAVPLTFTLNGVAGTQTLSIAVGN